MIPVPYFARRKIAVLGLGRSGLAVARALKAGGAQPICVDDSADALAAAKKAGFKTSSLESEADWDAIDALIVSPGIPHLYPAPHRVVAAATMRGVPIDNDIGLFFRLVDDWRADAVMDLLPDEDDYDAIDDMFDEMLTGEGGEVGPKVVCITGSNGKSTTTALIAHILAASGFSVQLGGNIGRGVLDLDPPEDDRTVYVLELSSYQTELARTLLPDVAVFVNLSDDHLDRHGGRGGYFAAKRRLFEKSMLAAAVIGVDEAEGRFLANTLYSNGAATVWEISVERSLSEARSSVFAVDGMLFEFVDGANLGSADLSSAGALRGRHNWQNAAAAYAACRALEVAEEAIEAAMATFPGLPHRMERIATRNEVLFVNDSKATNTDAAAKALGSYDRIHWIAGGKAKEGGIASLTPLFHRIAKAYLIGEAAESFAATLKDVPHEIVGTLDKAIAAAADAAKAGEIVLLSPACASFDQFRDYEARGEAFRSTVLALSGAEPI